MMSQQSCVRAKCESKLTKDNNNKAGIKKPLSRLEDNNMVHIQRKSINLTDGFLSHRTFQDGPKNMILSTSSANLGSRDNELQNADGNNLWETKRIAFTERALPFQS